MKNESEIDVGNVSEYLMILCLFVILFPSLSNDFIHKIVFHNDSFCNSMNIRFITHPIIVIVKNTSNKKAEILLNLLGISKFVVILVGSFCFFIVVYKRTKIKTHHLNPTFL